MYISLLFFAEGIVMKRWCVPFVAIVLLVLWGFWPAHRVSGEDDKPKPEWSGWVTDSMSRPIQGATVAIDPTSGGKAAATAETDREGRFRVTDPPAGRHHLLVGQANYLPIEEDGVATEPGTAPRAWVLRATDRTIEGTVHDPAGAPIAWARVSYPAEVFVAEELRVVQERLAVRTDAKGGFRIARDVRPAAACWVRAERTGFQPADIAVDLAAGDARAVDVRLDPIPAPVVEGRVVGADNLTAPGAIVEARGEGKVFTAVADDEGRFAIGGLPSEVDLLVRPSEVGRRAGSSAARVSGVRPPADVDVHLPWAPEEERPGNLEVLVSFPGEVTQADVFWIRDEARPFEEIHVDGKRVSASQGGLAPGPIHVFVRAGTWLAAKSLRIEPGAWATLCLSARTGRFMRAHVRDGVKGPPIMGAIALPYVDLPGGVAFELPPATADERGELTLRGLPDGCRVEVSAPGHDTREVVPRNRDEEVPLERR